MLPPNLDHLNKELIALTQDKYGNQKTYKDFLKNSLKVWIITRII